MTKQGNILKTVPQLPIGTKVTKRSNKPFKSGYKVGTISGYSVHPTLNVPCYLFEEDDSYVEQWRCICTQ